MHSGNNKDLVAKLKTRARTFEALENRNLLAGNVTASQSGSELTIILGDSSANVLTVTQMSAVQLQTRRRRHEG